MYSHIYQNSFSENYVDDGNLQSERSWEKFLSLILLFTKIIVFPILYKFFIMANKVKRTTKTSDDAYYMDYNNQMNRRHTYMNNYNTEGLFLERPTIKVQ